MDLAAWSRAAQKLGAIDRCSPWWIGDCIRYGNARFGEKYSRAAKLTGYDVQTLMNRVYVASHIEISRRRENLSWSHHDTVASLPPQDQDHWLDIAAQNKMSVADLRLELRAQHRRADHTAEPGHEHDSHDEISSRALANADVLVCPHCGREVPLAGAHSSAIELSRKEPMNL